MTHYDIDYTKLKGEAKRLKALEDLREFWGSDVYESFLQKCLNLKEDVPTLFGFRVLLSFGGVEGYPVKARHEHLWPTREDLRDEQRQPGRQEN